MNACPETIRCFVAFDLLPEAKRYLLQIIENNQRFHPEAKWISEHQLHITIRFFASLTPSQVNRVVRILEDCHRGYHPFDLKLGSLGVFSSWKRARVLWIGIDPAAAQHIKNIVLHFENQCAQNDLRNEEERDFSPHITLARWRTPLPVCPESLIPSEPLETSIQEINLYRSLLTPGGAVYDQLAGFSLTQI
ncbi:MAG: RNA 2',3'-cyclic phosphodiesterase [Candidatus Atribacteria bacterium]|nr:RNA 2',3'-cyclic phosphodiesterase [Candidatus Atribacteria bacterium]